MSQLGADHDRRNPRRPVSGTPPRARARVASAARALCPRAVAIVKARPGDVLLSSITREAIERFEATRNLDAVSNRTVNMDVGAAQSVEALRPLTPVAGPRHDVDPSQCPPTTCAGSPIDVRAATTSAEGAAGADSIRSDGSRHGSDVPVRICWPPRFTFSLSGSIWISLRMSSFNVNHARLSRLTAGPALLFALLVQRAGTEARPSGSKTAHMGPLQARHAGPGWEPVITKPSLTRVHAREKVTWRP